MSESPLNTHYYQRPNGHALMLAPHIRSLYLPPAECAATIASDVDGATESFVGGSSILGGVGFFALPDVFQAGRYLGMAVFCVNPRLRMFTSWVSNGGRGVFRVKCRACAFGCLPGRGAIWEDGILSCALFPHFGAPFTPFRSSRYRAVPDCGFSDH